MCCYASTFEAKSSENSYRNGREKITSIHCKHPPKAASTLLDTHRPGNWTLFLSIILITHCLLYWTELLMRACVRVRMRVRMCVRVGVRVRVRAYTLARACTK